MSIRKCKFRNNDLLERHFVFWITTFWNNDSFSCWFDLWGWIINFDTSYTILWFEPICFMRLISLYVNKFRLTTNYLYKAQQKMIKSRVKIKHFSIVGLMSPGWVRTQIQTHSDFCWTRGLGLGLWPTGLGLWSNGLGLTPDGLGLTAGLTPTLQWAKIMMFCFTMYCVCTGLQYKCTPLNLKSIKMHIIKLVL